MFSSSTAEKLFLDSFANNSNIFQVRNKRFYQKNQRFLSTSSRHSASLKSPKKHLEHLQIPRAFIAGANKKRIFLPRVCLHHNNLFTSKITIYVQQHFFLSIFGRWSSRPFITTGPLPWVEERYTAAADTGNRN
jgi:hypothetical protein